jgi:hypothetical protein
MMSESFTVKANKVGKPAGAGSVRVTIPRPIADEFSITNGTMLKVSRKKNQIIIEVE